MEDQIKMVKLENFSVFQLSSLFGSSNFLDSLIKNIHTYDTFYKIVFKVKYILSLVCQTCFFF